MNRVLMPLQPTYMCDHTPKAFGGNDEFLLQGAEETSWTMEIKGKLYISMIYEGPCVKCNQSARDRLEKKALEMSEEK